MKKYFTFFSVLCLAAMLLCACQSAPASSQSSAQSSGTSAAASQSAAQSTADPAPIPEPQPAPAPQPAPEPISVPDPNAKPNHTLYILMYHHIVEDGSNHNNWTITPSRLREDLQWLRDNGYTCVLPRELASGAPLPPKAVMITFDDGYESNYKLAYPILKEFNAKFVIALITHHMEDHTPGFLTWDMCREMQSSGLVEFGSHTHNLHVRSSEPNGPQATKRLPGESQAAYEARVFPDLQTSIDLISKHLGQAPVFLAYPHGIVDKWETSFVKEHFKVSVTTKHGPADISNGLYNLPRHNITVENPASKYLP